MTHEECQRLFKKRGTGTRRWLITAADAKAKNDQVGEAKKTCLLIYSYVLRYVSSICRFFEFFTILRDIFVLISPVLYTPYIIALADKNQVRDGEFRQLLTVPSIIRAARRLDGWRCPDVGHAL